jgi:hypothetical protein
VRERVIDVSFAKSASSIDNSIARRHAVIALHLVSRIKGRATRHRPQGESHPIDQFHGIDVLVRSSRHSLRAKRTPHDDLDAIQDARERAGVDFIDGERPG